MINYVAKQLDISYSHARVGIITVAIVFIVMVAVVSWIMGPLVGGLTDERISTHCLPIATDELQTDRLIVTGKALGRCWIETPDGSQYIVEYGIYDDAYGIKGDDLP